MNVFPMTTGHAALERGGDIDATTDVKRDVSCSKSLAELWRNRGLVGIGEVGTQGNTNVGARAQGIGGVRAGIDEASLDETPWASSSGAPWVSCNERPDCGRTGTPGPAGRREWSPQVVSPGVRRSQVSMPMAPLGETRQACYTTQQKR
ncbi:unnamed protein product [Ilex paraguariensis]|uniref:Uncharacterized protein n=1 Tax=Ilex paraguariensis TaxID=185542 RepID=A0ABC8TG55_9AQUA